MIRSVVPFLLLCCGWMLLCITCWALFCAGVLPFTGVCVLFCTAGWVLFCTKDWVLFGTGVFVIFVTGVCRCAPLGVCGWAPFRTWFCSACAPPTFLGEYVNLLVVPAFWLASLAAASILLRLRVSAPLLRWSITLIKLRSTVLCNS